MWHGTVLFFEQIEKNHENPSYIKEFVWTNSTRQHIAPRINNGAVAKQDNFLNDKIFPENTKKQIFKNTSKSDALK